MRPVIRKASAHGFTLVEIVMAVGIFAFAIIGVVFLLSTGIKLSAEVQRDSALSSALMTSAALVASSDPMPTSVYFDHVGSMTASTANAYYQFQLTEVPAPSPLSQVVFYTIKVTAPYPSSNSVGEFVVSKMK